MEDYVGRADKIRINCIAPYSLPVLERAVEEFRLLVDGGIVHNDVRVDVLEELRDGVGVRHVALPRVVAVSREREHCISCGVDVASVGDEDAAASLRQRSCHGGTDAAAAAGHDCELAL